jgi:hypothetical protein
VQAGDNVSIVKDSDTITISASTGSDGGTGGHTIQDDGNSLPVRPNLNFTGALSATDSRDATVVTVDTSSLMAADNNLLDVSDRAEALSNLGGVPDSTLITGHALTGNISLSTDDVTQGGTNK